MSITPLTIYLWQLADSVISASGVICFLATVFAVLSVISWIVTATIEAKLAVKMAGSPKNDDKEEYEAARWMHVFGRRLAIIFTNLLFISAVIRVFTPSSNTIAMMVVIPEIARSKVIQQDVPDLYNAAIEALKQQLKGEARR